MLQAHTGLYTDLYELTMAQGYFYTGRKDEKAAFDYFFRKTPFESGYVVFTGLSDVLDELEKLSFSEDDIRYLGENGFRKDFLDYLKEFKFRGDVYSFEEGSLAFPNETVLRVEGNIIEAQIIETMLLNILNFESLISTKASRMRRVAGDRLLADFGLRRAHGPGGILASKAAYLGGFDSTSNVYAGFKYGVDITGTQAHSWIQSFDDELTAFRKYAETAPENTVLLVDTYNTLKSGVPNAIKTGRELKEKGHDLKAIRLDSGDLSYLAKKSRKMLDEAGFEDTKIIASNQLDEHVIKSLLEQGAPIDAFGVGTELVTGKPSAALDGVYKLSFANEKPRLKLSENVDKISLPGIKKVFRFYNEEGMMEGDGVALASEDKIKKYIHPHINSKQTDTRHLKGDVITKQVMKRGERTGEKASVKEIRERVMNNLEKLPEEHQRFESPHTYKIGISEKLLKLRGELINQKTGNI